MENITADKVKPKYEQVKQIWAQMLSKYYDRPGHLNPQYLVDAPCSHCKSTAVDGEFVLNGFRHVTCTSCRTVYVTPRLKDACLEELYSDKYYSTFYAESMIPAFETRKRLIGTRKCEQVLKYSGTPNGRVLDIGCGIGEVIDAFRDKKWDCHAIEVNECAIKWLEEKKIRVFKGSFDVFPENEKFDVIMAWGVVEHVTNPKEFLKKVLRHLKPGGLFASEVPNGQCLLVDYCRKTGKDPHRILMGEQHIVLYSPEAYREIHEEAGFIEVHLQTNGLDVETIAKINETSLPAETIVDMQACIDSYNKGDLIRGFWRAPGH